MHFSVLIMHESDEETIMGKRNCEATEDDGASIEFQSEMTVKEAKKHYKNFIEEENKKEIKSLSYSTFEEFMEGEYSYLHLEGNEYGYNNNALGMYDWYEVGGRWKNTLPSISSEKHLKQLIEKQLDLNIKEIKEKYRDKADEYVMISLMSPKEACAYLELDGQDSMIISKDFTAQDIINWWRNIQRKWTGFKEENDAVTGMIHNMIIEEDYEETLYGEGDENINEKFFTEKYNYFLNLNLKEGREIKITIVDCHI